METLRTYSTYLSKSDLLSFNISSADKHEFNSTCIWKLIGYSSEVMDHIDTVMKCGIYPQKMCSYSKNICGISFFFCFKNICGIS